ncbi:hypothetical protein [Pedobacter sp. SYSU D00535]|uniref:hypothetical protein n=1 Tax=Pedobacter sp. SYSU D00535 TaxID=2810308 RepID=UPI001A973818|nr:hypothetical protein [Pedobacter sp. SYSU D00535]
MQKEKAFDLINNFFKVKLPKKIDYFVWNDLKKGEVLLKTPLAFTEPPLCLTHTSIANTLGHEMTHSISYFAAKPIKKKYLISEGVCVYFDLTKRDKVAQLKNINHSKYSIIDVWKGKLRVGNDIIYPLGGELVKRLIESFGREKFLQLLADQSYENARNLYGEKLDDLISGLQKDIRR